LHSHVLSQGEIDLLFVEFSVNDGADRDESIRGMEGIVRQCRRHSPRTDICLIYTAADKNLTDHMPFNIAVHEEVASYYDIPSVNFAARVYKLIQSKQVTWDALASDRVHPNDEGHALYAAFVREYLDEMLDDRVDSDGDKDPVRINGQEVVSLPHPLNPNNYEYAAMLEADLVGRLEGFEWRELSSEPLMNWRYDTRHLYTDIRDALLSFTVHGQCAGVLLLCGPDSGIFEYAIDGGPFHPMSLFDDWCLKAYRPIMAMFPIYAERESRSITIRHTGKKDERSTGTSLRILKLFSN
jgi:acyl-CoA thioesterase-1